MKHRPKDIYYGHTIAGNSPAYRSSLPYLFAGGAIGATLALLFAPRSGKQLRNEIANVSRKGLETVRDKARIVNEKTHEIAAGVREFASRDIGSKPDEQRVSQSLANRSTGELREERPFPPAAMG